MEEQSKAAQQAVEEEAALQAAQELKEMMLSETAGGEIEKPNTTMALFLLMQKQMQQQVQQQLEQQEALHKNQMQMLAQTLVDLGGGGPGAGLHGGGGHAVSSLPRMLRWQYSGTGRKHLWSTHTAISKLDTECDRCARRGVLREAIHKDWSRLWTTGVIGVDNAQDWRDIVELMSEYLRDQRSPLLDRLNFHDLTQFASGPLTGTTLTSRFYKTPAVLTST